MTALSTRSAHRSAGESQRARFAAARWLLAVAVLAGLFVMHTVGSLNPSAGAGHAVAAPASHEAGASADQHDEPHSHSTKHSDCPASDGEPHEGPCPDDHGHPGQVCQSGAPQAGVAAGAPTLTVDITAAAAAVVPSVSPVTTAAQAARGSGCGPPSLAELSILRT